MDTPNDIREFLTTRRARLTPDQVGLPDFGGRRRVPGLRREEVALVAGMSVEYYVRLERGNATGVSEAVLEGISRALQLDDAEHAHLYDLVRAANAGAHPATTQRTGQAAAGAARRAAAARRHARRAGLRAERPARHPRHEPARRAPCSPRCIVQPQTAPRTSARFVFLDPRAQRVLPGLGRHRAADRRDPAHRGRPRPVRPRAQRPGRRALHPQRRLPHPLGVPRRPRAPHRRKNITIPWSATSTSPTRPWSSPPNAGSCCIAYSAPPGIAPRRRPQAPRELGSG